MKHVPTSKRSTFSKAQREAALAAAPERVSDPDSPYDPDDAQAVAEFWAKGKVRQPGQRGPQKRPTKVALTVRYSPEVVAYFKATGEGWQTRMNEVLREYVERHRGA